MTTKQRSTGAAALGMALGLAAAAAHAADPVYPALGEIVRSDGALDDLIDPETRIEVLASGFDWSEGPVWVKPGQVVKSDAEPDGGFLLFSDVPRNIIYRWNETDGISVFLEPSGYTGAADYGAEPGSNGLLVDREGRLVCCEHGDRRVSRMSLDGGKVTIADRYEDKRFNSPNDVAERANGELYFTDPIYGLPQRADDSRRELPITGVYRVAGPGATVELLTDTFTRPNGIAFSPDQKTLYVAQSDPAAAIWKAFPVKDDGTLGEGRLFYDATEAVGQMPGLPDGLKVDATGNVFATGPGGVYVFSSEGKVLGRLATGVATANVGWGGPDGADLYITADMYLCRVRTKTKGAGW